MAPPLALVSLLLAVAPSAAEPPAQPIAPPAARAAPAVGSTPATATGSPSPAAREIAPRSKPPAMTFTGKKFPPPGSPEDQALLASLLQANAAVLSERARAITSTQRLRDAGYEAKLAEAARLDEGRAPRLEELRGRLLADWARVTEIMTRQWPVSPRVGCRPQGIQFEVLMGEPAGSRGAARLKPARDVARECLDRLSLALHPLRAANQALGATAAEVRAALAPPGK